LTPGGRGPIKIGMSIKIEQFGRSPIEARRNVLQAMGRGLMCRCPQCGQGRIFDGYLKVRHACAACGTELHHQRADDAPPYFTMFIVGHIIVAGVLAVEKAFAPDVIVHMLLWLPGTVILSLALLPVIKGALIGMQWALRMHGFGDGADPAGPEDAPVVGRHEGGR